VGPRPEWEARSNMDLKQDRSVWSGFTGVRLGTSDTCEDHNKSSSCIKRRDILTT
jgi:hypothetical protein